MSVKGVYFSECQGGCIQGGCTAVSVVPICLQVEGISQMSGALTSTPWPGLSSPPGPSRPQWREQTPVACWVYPLLLVTPSHLGRMCL